MDAHAVLGRARSVLVVDWPSRDVPDSLARAGLTVTVKGGPGPDDYSVYEVDGKEVVARRTGRRPDGVDIVYSHRPIAELEEIVATAGGLGAATVWVQSGRAAEGVDDPAGCWVSAEESRRAREIVEAAGLTYVDDTYIADAARALGAGPERRT